MLGNENHEFNVRVAKIGTKVDQVVGARIAREIVEGGEFYPPEESLRLGLVDEVVPPEEVLRRSIEWAERLGSMPRSAFEMIKRVRVEEIEAQVTAD